MWFVPGVSHAATVRVEGRALIYTATGSNENTLEVSTGCFNPFQVPCPPQIHLTDFGGVFGRSSAGEPILPGAGCEYQTPPPPPGQPPPPGPPPPVPIDRDVLCSAEVDLFDISLAGGDDWLFVSTDTPGVLRGDADDDRIEDGNGNDLVLGGTGNDVFRAKPGNDALSGGEGADTYYALQCPPPPQPCDPVSNSALDTGRDSFSGDEGRDIADFSDIFASERLSADGAQDDGKPGEGDNIGGDVEDILAGPFSDTLVGNASDNQLDGGEGSDTISGGPGQDVTQGGAGADSIDGGPGPDSLRGGDGSDSLNGGADPDSLEGGEGGDSMDGGPGPDNLRGGAGIDAASYGSRTAGVNVTLDNCRNDGEAGEADDVASDVEDVLGGGGPDDLTGSVGSNRLDGGSGEDFIDGRAGADLLLGGAAADTLRLRDRAADSTPSCGPGVDFVIADPRERTQRDCEDVDNVLSDRPSLGTRVAVQPGRATLKMQLPAAHRFVPLMDHVNLPVRSLIDTNAGQAKVTTTTISSRRRRQSGVFSGGLFQVLQARKRRDRGITELRLKGSSFSGCRSPAPRTNTRGRSGAVASRLSRRTIRRLRGSAKGRFRTRGRHSAATVRGTKWTMADRCDGTLTTVTRGKVAVRDFRRRKTIALRRGKSYLARAPG